MTEIMHNPHDPTNFNAWYWEFKSLMEENDNCPMNPSYLPHPHLAGRWWSQDDDTLDDYPVYFIFRGISVDILDAVNQLCDHCDEIYAVGGYYEPEDSGCDHDFKLGPCKFAGLARHIEKMLLCPPGTYELEGW